MMKYKVGERVVRKSSPEADTGTVAWADPEFDRVRVRWDASGRSSLINESKLKGAEIKTYPDVDSAQAAMDRGETVHIELGSYAFSQGLLQLALDLQAKERLEEWRECQRIEGESR